MIIIYRRGREGLRFIMSQSPELEINERSPIELVKMSKFKVDVSLMMFLH